MVYNNSSDAKRPHGNVVGALPNGSVPAGDLVPHQDTPQLVSDARNEKPAVVLLANGRGRTTSTLLYTSPSSTSGISGQPRVTNSSLRKSEEDLIHKHCVATCGYSGKSDSLSDLLNGSIIGTECYFASKFLLFGGSTSAPSLIELPTLGGTTLANWRRSESKQKCKATPKIVIDRPSDDEEEMTSDDVEVDDLEAYYSRQLVLSDWEEICRDLRVTEL